MNKNKLAMLRTLLRQKESMKVRKNNKRGHILNTFLSISKPSFKNTTKIQITKLITFKYSTQYLTSSRKQLSLVYGKKLMSSDKLFLYSSRTLPKFKEIFSSINLNLKAVMMEKNGLI